MAKTFMNALLFDTGKDDNATKRQRLSDCMEHRETLVKELKEIPVRNQTITRLFSAISKALETSQHNERKKRDTLPDRDPIDTWCELNGWPGDTEMLVRYSEDGHQKNGTWPLNEVIAPEFADRHPRDSGMTIVGTASGVPWDNMAMPPFPTGWRPEEAPGISKLELQQQFVETPGMRLTPIANCSHGGYTASANFQAYRDEGFLVWRMNEYKIDGLPGRNKAQISLSIQSEAGTTSGSYNTEANLEQDGEWHTANLHARTIQDGPTRARANVIFDMPFINHDCWMYTPYTEVPRQPPVSAEAAVLSMLRSSIDDRRRSVFETLQALIQSSPPHLEAKALHTLEDSGAFGLCREEYTRSNATDHGRAKRQIPGDLEIAAWVIDLVRHEAISPITAHHAGESTVDYLQFTLPNGVNAVLYPDASAPRVVIQAWHDVGGKDDPSGRSGMAHLIEHLMFQGNGYQAKLESLGGKADAETNQDFTVYKDIVPPNKVATVLALHASRLKAQLDTLDDALFEDARRDVVAERMRRDTPEFRAMRRLYETLYPAGHPYHDSDVIGSASDLANTTLQETKAWFKATYAPAGLTLVVAGNVDPFHIRERVFAHFESLPVPEFTPAPEAPPALQNRSSTEEDLTTSAPRSGFMRGWIAPPRSSPDFGHLDLLVQVLSTRLQTLLRPLDAFSVVTLRPGTLSSLFLIDISFPRNRDMDAIGPIIEQELQNIAAGQLSEEELTTTKQNYRNFTEDFLLSENEDKAVFLGECRVRTGTADCFSLQSSTRDISANSQSWLIDNGSHTVRISPARTS